MRVWSWVETLLEVVVVLFLVSMVVGQLLGQPVLLGYVTTGSMQPTLDPGDGFVAIPAALAGPVDEGDVVTFRAEEIQGGGLTTHRVVDRTDRGYVTRGDNNPFTDQDGGEPPVTDAQIVAVVWQPGGTVVSVPGVGVLVTGTQETLGAVQQRLAQLAGTRSLLGTQGVAYLLVALSVAAYVVDLLVGGDRNREGRDTSRQTGVSARLILLVLAGAVVLSATAAMVGPAGPQEFGVISSESDSPGLRVIEQGTTESTRYVLGNGGFVPMVTYVEPVTEGVTFEPRETVVPARSTVNATLSITAPEDTGYYRYFVVEHRYLHLLPQSTIRSLYRIHPWAPIVTIDALLAGSFYVLGAALVDTGRVRSRSRDAPSSLDRLRSRFR
ncbi:S26 family signal peptidase [Haloarcula pelagica]|uniref:S26 family signal peptidase n=1 Tax=Haloarcula pelagica TaxID=3033389 RepID=UPI0024C37963|nr:S26 family signal peptidase [Halomicroarcula sp. YJ-61-S]